MCPDDDQLLAEALAKTDEDVAESFQAKGYDLCALDAELLGLVAKLPSRHRGKRGLRLGRARSRATVTLGVLVSALVATSIPASPPRESRKLSPPRPHRRRTKTLPAMMLVWSRSRVPRTR